MAQPLAVESRRDELVCVLCIGSGVLGLIAHSLSGFIACMMPRDMDLIRELMLRLQHGNQSIPEGRTQQEVAYHVELLIEEGFLKGVISRKLLKGTRVPDFFQVQGITWKGHDFIKFVENDTVWGRTKDHFKKNAVAWTANLILEFLKAEGRKTLGLGP